MTKDAAEVMFKRLFGESKGLHSVRKHIQQAFDAARTAPAPKAEPLVVEETSKMNIAAAEKRYGEAEKAHFSTKATALVKRAEQSNLPALNPRLSSWTTVYDLGVIDAERATPDELFELAVQAFKVPSK